MAGVDFLQPDVAACTETFSDRRSIVLDGPDARPAPRAGARPTTTAGRGSRSTGRLVTGDFVTWVFPNAGNPQKVQRYPVEWAQALRDMAAMDAELLLPAHALPIAGTERIRTVLLTTAGMLEQLVADVVDAMNAGATLDQILHDVRVDPELLALPYLRPVYDEPEFVVRNVWRSYGGWWDGDPAHLKPPPGARPRRRGRRAGRRRGAAGRAGPGGRRGWRPAPGLPADRAGRDGRPRRRRRPRGPRRDLRGAAPRRGVADGQGCVRRGGGTISGRGRRAPRQRLMLAFVLSVPANEADLASDALWALGVAAIEERSPEAPTQDHLVELWTSLGTDVSAITSAAEGFPARWRWRTVDVDPAVADTLAGPRRAVVDRPRPRGRTGLAGPATSTRTSCASTSTRAPPSGSATTRRRCSRCG